MNQKCSGPSDALASIILFSALMLFIFIMLSWPAIVGVLGGFVVVYIFEELK